MCKNMEPGEDFFQKRNTLTELCTEGRKLGGAIRHEPGKGGWGQTVESMTPGPSEEKRKE